MEIARFFEELATRMETARRKDRTMYRRFFAELRPRLETARALEAELDRHLARRFNVLDYMRTDELGLSRIVADLLNPRGPHGQGRFFLERFVEGLGEQVVRLNLSTDRISVAVEEVIPSIRRIDVYVQIGEGDGAQCLAIENKPYAGDRKNQVKDYLKFLNNKYQKRFVLVYLSPQGEGPSNWSIAEDELEGWEGRFAILPYCTIDSGSQGEDPQNQSGGFEEFRLPCSLADWFKECRRSCEVDRLRWFLRDAEAFCQRTFGGQPMTTDSETKALEDFLLSNPQNLAIARAVHEAWPAIRGEICKKFLNQLRCRVESKVKERMPEFAEEISVGCMYLGEQKYRNYLWLYCTHWTEYNVQNSRTNRRTSVHLEALGRGPFNWICGVRSPLAMDKMAGHDKTRRLNLQENLQAVLIKELGGNGPTDWWPWHRPMDREFRDWNNLVLELHDECQENAGGRVTTAFVNAIVDTAVRTIPIINRIEGPVAETG